MAFTVERDLLRGSTLSGVKRELMEEWVRKVLGESCSNFLLDTMLCGCHGSHHSFNGKKYKDKDMVDWAAQYISSPISIDFWR